MEVRVSVAVDVCVGIALTVPAAVSVDVPVGDAVGVSDTLIATVDAPVGDAPSVTLPELVPVAGPVTDGEGDDEGALAKMSASCSIVALICVSVALTRSKCWYPVSGDPAQAASPAAMNRAGTESRPVEVLISAPSGPASSA